MHPYGLENLFLFETFGFYPSCQPAPEDILQPGNTDLHSTNHDSLH